MDYLQGFNSYIPQDLEEKFTSDYNDLMFSVFYLFTPTDLGLDFIKWGNYVARLQ